MPYAKERFLLKIRICAYYRPTPEQEPVTTLIQVMILSRKVKPMGPGDSF